MRPLRSRKPKAVRTSQRKSRQKKQRTCSRSKGSDTGFFKAWKELMHGFVPTQPKRRGKPAQVSLTQVLPALIFHFMNGAGTLGEHFSQLFGFHYADSSLSDRRARLPWEVFTEMMRQVLRPIATAREKESFWRGWRLLALDGTQFSLSNTPQVKATRKKARSRRGKAAFAKIGASVLLEVGTHNPIAAAISREAESEWKLGLGLLDRLPAKSLLLADRLYGCAAFVAQTLQACQKVGSHFLFRVRSNLKVKTLKRLKDGSRIIEVGLREKDNPNKILRLLEVREIEVDVTRKGFRSRRIRLWTSLLDCESAPAQELAQVYTQRWEHELYYRSIKHELRRGNLLQSHTVNTAAQEIAAIIMVSALIAPERVRVAGGQRAVLQVSFVKVLELLQPLWLILQSCKDVLSAKQKATMIKRVYALMAECITQPKRMRSCPRKVRQPISGWPRMLENRYDIGPVTVQVV